MAIHHGKFQANRPVPADQIRANRRIARLIETQRADDLLMGKRALVNLFRVHLRVRILRVFLLDLTSKRVKVNLSQVTVKSVEVILRVMDKVDAMDQVDLPVRSNLMSKVKANLFRVDPTLMYQLARGLLFLLSPSLRVHLQRRRQISRSSAFSSCGKTSSAS
mmetsp:Transcript_72722/g.151926  ORF Transcript_72722/g.151926 Transcript_72722/m.151926 type:complete len:163 (-) Transcript_72722:16-504(-)